ncbi:hypothetical protein RB597_008038 [Gaeumannomyces tritici]
MSGLTPTYHFPPNFSIGPAPSGPIDIGTILNNLRDVEVLNEDCRVAIPQAQLYCHHKRGFTATRSRMRKGEFGLWAKLVGVDGIGGELSWASERTDEDVYKFRRLDTITFSPSAAYLRSSMREPDVAEFVEGTGFEPVYMVTGLKIAIGPSVSTKKATSFAGILEGGVQQPGGAPIEIGPRANRVGEDTNSEGWEGSDDFIIGLRVKKLVYKRAWLSRKRRDEGELLATPYIKGAQLVGADDDYDEKEEGDEVLEIGLDEEMNGMTEAVETDDGGTTSWIVPAAIA